MARLNTNTRHKLRKALNRVERTVIMEIRNMIEQQNKWKAQVLKKQSEKTK